MSLLLSVGALFCYDSPLSMEPYAGGIEICNDIFTVGMDYVFVTAKHSSQNNISMMVKQNLPTHLELIARSDASFCYDQLVRLICKYYLSPCGTDTPPHSICAEDCYSVQRNCPTAWEALQQGLEKYQFIDCNSPTAFIFPLPSCCTGLGQNTIGTGIPKIT